MEIAIRRRRRLRVVLDFDLRPRLACFHDRALFSKFASHSAVEIAIRRRPRLRVVVDFDLRPRRACFHDRALFSKFASHTTWTQHYEVARTTFQKILNYYSIPGTRCDHRFQEIEIYCLHIFVGDICMSANRTPALAC